MDTSHELLTAQELAAELKVPVSTVYSWRGNEQGPPAIKVGKHLRYRRGDVEAWLEARRAASN